MATNLPEVWLRGPVEGVHALMQSVEEVQKMLQDFRGAGLWERPAGVEVGAKVSLSISSTRLLQRK